MDAPSFSAVTSDPAITDLTVYFSSTMTEINVTDSSLLFLNNGTNECVERITDCNIIDSSGNTFSNPNLRLGDKGDNFSLYLTLVGGG